MTPWISQNSCFKAGDLQSTTTGIKLIIQATGDFLRKYTTQT